MDLKVKKFRIRPRTPTVARILKSLLGVKQLPADVEAILPDEIQRFTARVAPVAFYQTWSRDDVPVQFRPALQAAGLDKSVSISAIVATAGAVPEEMISEFLLNGETMRSQIMTALGEEAADLAVNFLFRLLVDDAKADDCELAEPLPVFSEPLLTETLSLLQAEQEGILVDQASHLTPRFTRIALAAWLPIAKRKRQASPPKKKSV